MVRADRESGAGVSGCWGASGSLCGLVEGDAGWDWLSEGTPFTWRGPGRWGGGSGWSWGWTWGSGSGGGGVGGLGSSRDG